MAAPNRNRYALFTSADGSSAPMSRPAVDYCQTLSLNQVAHDSIPWEEVRKRGAPAAPLVPPVRRPAFGTMNRNKAMPTRHVHPGRDRPTPAATTEGDDKALDPYRNWCGVCSLKLPNKTMLLTHIKQSDGHQHYCNLCQRVFKDRNGLKNHIGNSLDHSIFCNLCLSAFKDHWGLRNHFENNYSVRHEFACLTCLMGFKTRADLEQHLQSAAKHIWCGTCQRRFRNQDERDEHWRMSNRHKHCMQPGCDFDAPDQAVLAEHLKRDHFHCQGCKRIFQSMTKLNQHYEGCSLAVSCPQCGQHCAGKAQLALHLENCYVCDECGFQTHHEGNYYIHKTKHSSADIGCWGCNAPMRKYSSLINHLESGNCPKLGDVALLVRCLGKWWYSPLYMDLDMHAHIRTGRVDMHEVQEWMDNGALHPFICRHEDCGKEFGHLSSLVLHCESKACGWHVDRLNMPGLEKEFKQTCLRRYSGMG